MNAIFIQDVIEDFFELSRIAKRKGYWPTYAIMMQDVLGENEFEPAPGCIAMDYWVHKGGISYVGR